MRGLKHGITAKLNAKVESHPTRVRGLKLIERDVLDGCVFVAPHTGAWIETLYRPHTLCTYFVAPHTGAWIETLCVLLFNTHCTVAPHTGAWIETLAPPQYHLVQPVAPHTGAWIETWLKVSVL